MDIKFRALDKMNKEFIRIEDIMINDDGSFLAIHIRKNGNIRTYSIDEFIIMQYTGLKDKNGKEIYFKFDVISFRDHQDTIELGWSKNNEYGLIWSTSKNIITKQDEINIRYEIIGNIKENPELLEIK